jgi:ADP-ribose diphosphatase
LTLKKLETLASRLLFRNPYWEYRLDEYTLPGGQTGEYHYVHTPGAAMVIPVHDDGTLVLVRQFRYLWKKESMEFPCGGVKGADSLSTAKNELAEEARLAAAELKYVGEFNPFNGATDEICRVYLATGLSEAHREKDASEEFEILRIPVSEFEEFAENGNVWDGMTLAAWMVARRSVFEFLRNTEK